MDDLKKIQKSGILNRDTQIPLIQQDKKKRGRDSYPMDFKIKSLLLLKRNKYQLLETANQIGIHINTLSRWRNQLGTEVFREDDALPMVPVEKMKNQLQDYVMDAKMNLQVLTTEIYETATKTEKELIERIRIVAKDSSNLDHLGRCLKIMHEIVTGKEIDENTPKINQSNSSYYTLVMQSIIKVEEDLKWKIKQEQELTNQSKSLPPSPSGE